jgi:hypothetical protein
MELKEAEKEFWLRNYVWAKAEWEKEINESFPHLRKFKTGHSWEIYQFMQKLDKSEQLAWAMGRLKRRSREEASKWGDRLSEKEESLCQQFDAFWRVRDQFQIFKQLRNEGKISDAEIVFDLVCAPAARIICGTDSTDAEFLYSQLDTFLSSVPQSFEEQVKARKLAGEKIKFVSKKKLQKILTQKVKDVFGNQYVECRIDEGHWTAFDIKCGGWMLQTQFNFGRKPGYQQSVLGYWHNICSQKKAPHPAMPEVMYPVAHLCRCVSWPCSWEWEYLTEEDVELACEETFKYCRRFFDAAPRLLKGLGVEGISED